MTGEEEDVGILDEKDGNVIIRLCSDVVGDDTTTLICCGVVADGNVIILLCSELAATETFTALGSEAPVVLDTLWFTVLLPVDVAAVVVNAAAVAAALAAGNLMRITFCCPFSIN